MHWLKLSDTPSNLLLVLHAQGQMVLWNTETGLRMWRKTFNETLISFALDPFDPQKMAGKTLIAISYVFEVSSQILVQNTD